MDRVSSGGHSKALETLVPPDGKTKTLGAIYSATFVQNIFLKELVSSFTG